ncbi:MAG: TlpA family protein disulfide reductase [Bacteroidetes bacterium]|nr:MAG: TlpA family protein disulfide reductase [Bacteroidota bacterium]
MRNLFVITCWCLVLTQTHAQKRIHVSGKISGFNSTEPTYVDFGGKLQQFMPAEDGSFSVDASIRELPGTIRFVTPTAKGKIINKTPLIWVASDSVKVNVDWLKQTFQSSATTPFQSTSEKIEALKPKEQIDFTLNNSSSVVSLYFANMLKKDIAIDDLKKFCLNVKSEFGNTDYFKRIETYVAAKSLPTLKKGETVKDFTLPDKDGNQIQVIKENNQPKLIALFSSSCQYSIASIALVEQISKLPNNNFELITIWDDSDKETWLTAYQDKKQKITWTNLWDGFEFASTYFELSMLPTFYVVNADGKLTDVIEGVSKASLKRIKKIVQPEP